MIDRYLQKNEFGFDLNNFAVSLDHMQQLVAEHVNSMQRLFGIDKSSTKTDDELFSYPVPELGEGGSCSLFNQIADKPFDLTSVFGERSDVSRQLLTKLHHVVDYVVAKSQVNWFGIYQTFDCDNKGKRLVKLAYDGAVSRPEYPLNEQFAALSNNVQVGLSGQSKVINDVEEYITQGGSYYTCDPKVQSEVCLPIFDAKQRVIGIIDAEAFNTGFFNAASLALLVASCVVISGILASVI